VKTAATGLLLRDTELDGRRRADVRITDATIAEIAPRLAPQPGEAVLDARGGALLPGLCDHHLHLHALAAHSSSVPCGPPEVTDTSGLAGALAGAAADERGWVRGVGYIETVAGDLDADTLDRLHPGRPVRIQHRSGALWMLNGAAVAVLGLAGGDHPGIERDRQGAPTGRLWRADDWLRTRLPRSRPPDLAPVGARLAGLGITSVTDATPDLDAAAIEAVTDAMASGAVRQHVQLLGVPVGWRPAHAGRTPSAGPYKIVMADSALPDLDTLTERITEVHARGRAVAVHCVTREALVLLLAAFEDAGTLRGDRVEHAALVPAELLPTLAGLGLRVVTQPGFLGHRGDDFLRDVPEAEHVDLYRCRSLTEAGVPLAPSSDAPYGPLDPWAVIAAAVTRRTPSGRTAGPVERLSATDALAGYLADQTDPGGPPRRIRTGAAADLVLLRVPRAVALSGPSADHVRATVIGGTLVWDGGTGR
jgi:predicted amidohydrolase YtcJ